MGVGVGMGFAALQTAQIKYDFLYFKVTKCKNLEIVGFNKITSVGELRQ